MRVPTVAIYTLAALGACGINPVLANLGSPSGTQQSGNNVVVPAQASSTPVNATTVVIPNSTSSTQPPSSNSFVVPAETTSPPPVTGIITQPSSNVPQPSNVPPGNDLALTALEVKVVGVTGELEQIVRNTIKTRLGGGTSENQVQRDVATLLETALFTDVRGTTQTTPQGIKVVYQVQPVVLRSLQLSNAKVLPASVANDIFKPQFGQPASPTAMRQGFDKLNQWYKEKGYALAQVLEIKPNRNGVLSIDVAEGLIGEINVRFVDKEGQVTQGRTKRDFITNQVKLKPGEVFQIDVARKDVQNLYQLGLFDKADIALNGDARKVEVIYELTESPARSVNAGAGYSASSGIVGTLTYKDQNVGGVNQQVGVNIQASTRDIQFDGKFSDPYNPNNPDRLGYTINAFRRRGLSQTFDDTITLPNGDQAREGQLGGGITFSKPVDNWQASVGLNYTRTSIRDGSGNVTAVDAQGNPLTFSKTGVDDLVTLSAGISQDMRDNAFNPTQGSVLSLTTEQSVPVGSGSIFMNRLQANYSQYIPTNVLGKDQPEVLAFNVQGGTTIGDLPPYQAFNLGGSNSVRGYGTGEVGTGRSFVLASAEYRFPIVSLVGGVLFGDFGSDLGTGNTVPGEPGVVRGKPGTGFGYGAGLRLNSPIGIIRADYGINDQGESRLQFGFGQRF